MKTHTDLGPGLGEELYHQNFVSRLLQAGIEHLSKPRRDLIYRGHVADTFEADIVIEGQLITELKALRAGFAAEHFTQLLNYSKFWRINTGLLLDYGKASLIKQRVIQTSRTATFPSVTWPGFVTNRNVAEGIFNLAANCLGDIGLGYHETTWIGLMSAALKAEGVSFVSNPKVDIPSLGRASLRCLVIENQCAVTIPRWVKTCPPLTVPPFRPTSAGATSHGALPSTSVASKRTCASSAIPSQKQSSHRFRESHRLNQIKNL